MTKPESPAIRVHDDPEYFREATNFTAAQTAFAGRLIEKDYFCSVLLDHLATTAGEGLVFKGGTCLAKVHAGFYRLSEDLDFVISMPVDATRPERRRRVAGVKLIVAALPDVIPCFRIQQPMAGANQSTQYNGIVGYESLLGGQLETIKIEVSLREPLLTAAAMAEARSILLDPVSNEPMVSPVQIQCISKTEAFAEKFRAALTRREVAVRDFFDIDYAVRRLGLLPQDEKMVHLVSAKLATPGNDPVDVSEHRLAALRQQIEPQLKPVLRERDFTEFDLDRAFKTVVELAKVAVR